MLFPEHSKVQEKESSYLVLIRDEGLELRDGGVSELAEKNMAFPNGVVLGGVRFVDEHRDGQRVIDLFAFVFQMQGVLGLLRGKDNLSCLGAVVHIKSQD